MEKDKAEQKILEANLKKQEESRKIRSTENFYDEDYWGKDYQARFGTSFTENDKQVQVEVNKKANFINRYMPGMKSILDVACSFGFLTAKLRDEGKDAWGVDISQPAIDRAPERVRPYLSLMNIKDLSEFDTDRFELVTAFDVFEHLYIEEIVKAVEQICRVASKFVLIRVPAPSYNAEPWVADMTAWGLDKEHVSNYPWEFWARRFAKVGKFRWWFTKLWSWGGKEETCEAWIVFKRI